jgi:1-deoxy-D-xylulose-5-phosphate reductoisomerase
MRRLAILGSTGSIGTTTLDLVGRFGDRFSAVSLAGGRNVERLAEQVRRFEPALVATADEQGAERLRALVPDFTGEIACGAEGLERVATAPGAELVISALVGALGLRPTLCALEAGIDVALANKEVLVVAGELVHKTAARAGAEVFPLDSEHNAIFQALHGHNRAEVKRIILTASGGPFLHTPRHELESVTLDQALEHPTWKMGDKITIDSSTLMNKGLEVIEAFWFFDVPVERIDVVVHPQSIVHSMVEYIDGSVIAQLGIPDMAVPISYILGYPHRLPLSHLPSLDLVKAGKLEFFAPDTGRFPCLRLAYEALRARGTAPAVLNGANEIAVASFLDRRIGYLDIPRILEGVLADHHRVDEPDLAQLMEADAWAREASRRACALASLKARSLVQNCVGASKAPRCARNVQSGDCVGASKAPRCARDVQSGDCVAASKGAAPSFAKASEGALLASSKGSRADCVVGRGIGRRAAARLWTRRLVLCSCWRRRKPLWTGRSRGLLDRRRAHCARRPAVLAKGVR